MLFSKAKLISEISSGAQTGIHWEAADRKNIQLLHLVISQVPKTSLWDNFPWAETWQNK